MRSYWGHAKVHHVGPSAGRVLPTVRFPTFSYYKTILFICFMIRLIVEFAPQEFYELTLLDETKSLQQKTIETLQIASKWERNPPITNNPPLAENFALRQNATAYYHPVEYVSTGV
jgi:hypothetical protein